MAKAVLVMDVPERCDMCDLRFRELPEKKETNYYMNNKEKGIVEGCNACLDAIDK